MNFEVIVAIFSVVAFTFAAYVCRRSFAVVQFSAIALFMVGTPILRVLAGGATWDYSDDVILVSYISVILYGVSFLVFALALKDRSFNKIINFIHDFYPDEKILRSALKILAVAWAFRLYRWYVYGIFFSGSTSEEAILNQPYWVSVLGSILPMLVGSATIIILVSLFRGEKKWMLFIIVAEFIWGFSSGGRREFVFFTILILVVSLITRIINIRFALLLISFSAISIYILTPLFLETRNNNINYLSQGKSPTVALQLAISDAYKDCGIGLGCIEMSGQNIARRGNAMEFMKIVVHAENSGRLLLYGEGLFNSINWAIPNFFINKPALMTEQFVQNNFGIQLIDDALSVPSLAYADVGMVGCILAGICVFFYIRVYTKFAFNQKSIFVFLAMVYGLVSILWNIEGDPLSYVILARNSLIIILSVNFSKWFFYASKRLH